MRIAGIIAEYDPFHKGHAAHIAATKAENGGNASHIVVVMSGNFTQRGEPALVDKFIRADMALANGADLVLELPLPWAMSPAETFAMGGVSILNALGCVNLLSFGSECGNVDTLKTLASLAENREYQEHLRHSLLSGIPYAAAVQRAAAQMVGDETANHLASSNNTLGIEYLRAANKLGGDFSYFTLTRQGTLHNENAPNQGFASASLIRQLLQEGKLEEALSYMPEPSGQLLSKAIEAKIAPSNRNVLQASVLPILRRLTLEELTELPWMSEGLENRLYKAIRSVGSYDQLLEELKTKRYPMARLKRIIWAAVLGLTKEDVGGAPLYIRVLGMNERGREILSISNPTLPLLTRAAQLEDLGDDARRIFEMECRATDLHALTLPHPAPSGRDCTQKMIIR